MADIPNQIVENIFPEERNRLVTFLKRQKRNLRAWLIALILVALLPILYNFLDVLRVVLFNFQTVFDSVLLVWIVTLVVLPFIWPQKPGDTFSENFRAGVNPRIWEYEGSWHTELDENGKPVLNVTNSELGGLAIPCLSWTDFELQFETRIMKACTAWMVRASSLNDCFMVQLTTDLIRPHIRASGLWEVISSEPHGLPIKVSEWFSVRTLVRGAWITVYIFINGKEHLTLQQRLLGARPAVPVEIHVGDQGSGKTFLHFLAISTRIGSFGFRLFGEETAQFRNIKAYRLR